MTEAFLREETVYLIDPDGRIEPFDSDVEAAHARGGAQRGCVLAQLRPNLRRLARRPLRFGRRDMLLQNGPSAGQGNPRYVAIRTRRYKYVQYV